MTNWKFIVEASMGWKSETMSIHQIHNIKNNILYLIKKNSISQNVNIQYEIYDEKKGTITFEFYSPTSKTEILSLLSDVSFPGFLNFRLIEIGSWNLVIPPPFTPKYSKEVIERTINDLKTDFEKKSEDEKDRIDLNIRTLKRYLNGCISGHTDSDYETKIDIIMKQLNNTFTPKYSKEVIEQAIYDFEKKSQDEKDSIDKSQDEKDRIDLNIRTLKRYLNGCISGHTDSDYETKIDIIMKELNK